MSAIEAVVASFPKTCLTTKDKKKCCLRTMKRYINLHNVQVTDHGRQKCMGKIRIQQVALADLGYGNLSDNRTIIGPTKEDEAHKVFTLSGYADDRWDSEIKIEI